MKRWILLLLALALLIAGLVAAERQRADAPPSAGPVLYLVADSERELTRLPSHFTRISDADEIAYGNKLADRFLLDRGQMSADASRVEAYVQEVGSRVASHAHRKLPYRFHYVPRRTFINAFSLPGGHVFIGAGLAEQMTTEDELASVLGHEVEHVDHYHCAERLQIEAALRKIPLSALLEIPISVFESGYSKDQELEADREGVLLAAGSGYSAAGALRAFEMLTRLSDETAAKPARTPQQEAARVAAGVLTGYFQSHPPTVDRAAQVRTMIARQPALAAPPERDLRIESIFLARHGLDAVEQEKFADAVDLATRSLQEEPGYPPALEALCEGDYALARFDAAQTAHRDLLSRDAAAADRVEKWAATRADNLFDRKDYDREIALVASVLTVQHDDPGLLRLTSRAYAMKGDVAAATSAAATMHRLYPDRSSQNAAEAASAANDLLAARNFPAAVAMSKVALAFDPKQTAAFRTLGDAEFAQAHFEEATGAYRDLLDDESSDAAWLRSFTNALGAAHPASASGDLDALLAAHHPKQLSDADVQVEKAGLALMSGSDTAAREIMKLVDAGSVAPEHLGRLGWWYFRARRVADGDAVLRKAQILRPGDPEIRSSLAWTLLEEAKPAGPPLAGDTGTPDSLLQNGWDVRNALAAWQEGRRADASRQWSAIGQSQPQWLNHTWREALYPQRINDIAQQLDAASRRPVK